MTSAAGTTAARDERRRPPRPCPVCASLEHDLLYKQRFEDFDAGSITNAYDVVACRACGACFATGLPDPAKFSEYYGQSTKYDASASGSSAAFDAARHRGEADFIADYVGDRATSVLDIGTATGGLLVALRDRGFRSVHGVEPSPDAARTAREVHGLDVVAGDARSAQSSGDVFGVVCLVAVLEHLLDPRAAVSESAELMQTDGLLYLLVPDAARFDEYVDAPFQQFSVEHINYFTLTSLTNLVRSVGLDVVVARPMMVTPSADAEGPGIEVLCTRLDRLADVAVDLAGVQAVRRYVDRSAQKELGILDTIDGLAREQQPMYVWGTGTNALHLLAASRLGDCNIVAFVDSNPHYAGRQLAGRPVMGPGELTSVDAPILIASAISQTSIASAARARFGPDVPLILLY